MMRTHSTSSFVVLRSHCPCEMPSHALENLLIPSFDYLYCRIRTKQHILRKLRQHRIELREFLLGNLHDGDIFRSGWRQLIQRNPRLAHCGEELLAFLPYFTFVFCETMRIAFIHGHTHGRDESSA